MQDVRIGRHLVSSTLMLVVAVVGLGIIYPLGVTFVAQVGFPAQANGQLITRDGHVVGSRLIGQRFASLGYFRSRPSAAGYDASASGGSNLGPTNHALVERVRADVDAAIKEDGPGPVPADLVMASGSGLDPHISPEAAAFQVRRVARERGTSVADVWSLVAANTEPPQFGVLGDARVNVLLLNLALDGRYPMGHR